MDDVLGIGLYLGAAVLAVNVVVLVLLLRKIARLVESFDLLFGLITGHIVLDEEDGANDVNPVRWDNIACKKGERYGR